MSFEPGNVVALKSGGQPMTVARVNEDTVECIWVGEEGELFRESLPAIVLQAAEYGPDEEDEDEDGAEDDAEAETEETETEVRKIA